MLAEDELQTPLQVGNLLNTDGPSYQTRHPIAPLVVQSFGHARPAAALFARSMLPGAEEFRIDALQIGVDQLLAIQTRNAPPQLLQALEAAVPQKVGKDLSGQAADSNPQVQELSSSAKAHDQFIDFQGIAANRLGECLVQVGVTCLFLSVLRTVSRLTLSMRAIAR